MMAETKTSLEKDHQKAMTEVETQYKTIIFTEEEKIKHQQSLQSMEEDMEAELATKKTEIEQLHQQQLDDLNAELEEKLSVLQQDHQQQEAKERDVFSNKLDQLRKQLEMVKNTVKCSVCKPYILNHVKSIVQIRENVFTTCRIIMFSWRVNRPSCKQSSKTCNLKSPKWYGNTIYNRSVGERAWWTAIAVMQAKVICLPFHVAFTHYAFRRKN